MDPIRLIDRTAVIIQPQQPFYDWLTGVNRRLGLDPVHDDGDLNHASVYLVPEFESVNGPIEYVKCNVAAFFKGELAQWITDPALWPEDLSWSTFNEWMDIRVSEMVFDSIHKPAEGFGDSTSDGFDYFENLRGPDGNIDFDRASAWVEEVVAMYKGSPEHDGWAETHPNVPPGLGAVFFHFLHGYADATEMDARPHHLEQFLFDFMPRKVLVGPTDVKGMLADLRAFFEFLGRKFAFPHQDMLAVLDEPGLAKRVARALDDPAGFDMAKRMVHEERSAGRPFTQSNKVGRNEPCPCGSGKKYKKCCG